MGTHIVRRELVQDRISPVRNISRKKGLVIAGMLVMPYYYDNQGCTRQITKNNMTIITKNGVRRSPHLMAWYETMEITRLYSANESKVISKWTTDIRDKYGSKWFATVETYWYLTSYRTDCHNYIIMLMDGLQHLFDINDRKLLPQVTGMCKIQSKETIETNTFVRYIITPMASGTEGERREKFEKKYLQEVKKYVN
jgi:hypothetical protein